MDQIFSIDNISTLLMLVLLQAVLGFDNLLYISIESKRVPVDSQASVRRLRHWARDRAPHHPLVRGHPGHSVFSSTLRQLSL